MHDQYKSRRSLAKFCATALAVLSLCGVHQRVFALAFVPTPTEWAGWPEYCKARYTVSGAGQDSSYSTMVSKATVDKWAGNFGTAWNGMHHFCAAMIIFERGRHARDPRDRDGAFGRVVSEVNFSMRSAASLGSQHPIVSVMQILRGRALYELGRKDQGYQDIQQAIKQHPELPDGYAAYGFNLRRERKLAEARDILARGIEASSGGSAELRYLLGLVMYELKDYPGALLHAREAYKKGYPLPALRRKLEAVGQWKE